MFELAIGSTGSRSRKIICSIFELAIGSALNFEIKIDFRSMVTLINFLLFYEL